MHRNRFNKLLIRPSFLSATVCVIAAVAVPIGVNWSYVLDNFLFYDYFFGVEGIVTTLQAARDGQPAVIRALSDDAVRHNAVILLGALAAAFVLFVSVRLLIRLLDDVSFTLKEMQAADTPAKHVVERELVQRAGVRFLVAGLWAFYTFIFIEIILPFVILASKVGLDGRSTITEGVSYILFAGTMVALALHIHVILARLLLLRPRIFAVEEALISE
jgi:hypothetical protein